MAEYVEFEAWTQAAEAAGYTVRQQAGFHKATAHDAEGHEVGHYDETVGGELHVAEPTPEPAPEPQEPSNG